MSTLNRKLIRELFAAKGMLAAIIGIIVVGIMCFVAMASLYFNLLQSRDQYYAQSRMADFWVDLKKLPLSEVDPLREIPGISTLQTRISFPVRVDLDEVNKPISGQIISLPEHHGSQTINNIYLRSGSYFSDRSEPQVIVTEGFAKAHQLKPGDHLRLILNERTESFRIVGLAISAEFIYMLSPNSIVPDHEAYGVFFIKREDAEAIFDFDGACNQLIGELTPARREFPEELLDRLEHRLEPFGVVSTTPRKEQISNWFLTSEIDGLKVSVTIVPTIFLTVAALVLNVLMRRQAEQQRTIVGTLKALGYSNLQIFGHFVKYGVSVGLIGGVLGVVAGYFMAGGMTLLYQQYYEFPKLINLPYPGIWAIGLLISVGFSVLGTMRGVQIVLRLNPAEAMRPKPPTRGRRLLMERIPHFWNALPFTVQLVFRGIFRNRMRSLITIFAAGLGSSLILMTLHMKDAMYELVDFQFDKVLISDVELAFSDPQDYAVVYEVARLPGVDSVEPVFNYGCTFQHGHREKDGSITGLIPGARLTVPRNAEGDRVPVPEDGLLMSRTMADILEVQPGDWLTVIPVRGDRTPRQVLVKQVVDSYIGMNTYTDFDALNHLAGEVEAVSTLQLKTSPGRAETKAFFESLRDIPAVQSVSSLRDQKDKLVKVLIEQMMVSVVVIILFAGLLFFGSILNASLASLSERSQEIATLRVLGYAPREIGGMFLGESLMLNGLGTLCGLPLGYWLSLKMDNMYDTELFRMPFVIHPASWIWTVVLGMIFTLLAHLFVARAIRRMNWLGALNVKE